MPQRDQRVVVLAGASSDTGRAIAARLSADGHTVIALGTSIERLATVCATDRIEVDLTDADACTAVAERVLAERGRVDGVVHLVGGWSAGQDDDGWARLAESSITTLRNTTRAFRGALADSGDGRFAMISSTAVTAPTWSNANYAAAKAAAETWTLALASGWRKAGSAAAVVFVVRSIGDGESSTSVSVIADRMAGLWQTPAGELNGARIDLS